MDNRIPKDKTALTQLLQAMLQHCQELKELLKVDGDYLAKNSLVEIDQSNQTKITLIEQLGQLASQFSTIYPKGFLQQLTEVTNQTSGIEAAEVKTLVKQLNAEVLSCSQLIAINSNLVFANLQMVKDVWDKMIVLNSGTGIYDANGAIAGT